MQALLLMVRILGDLQKRGVMPLEKSILLEYSDVKEEIKDLRRRIDEGRRELDRLNDMIVTDSVACGKKGKKPIRTVKIQGKPDLYIVRKRNALKHSVDRLTDLETDLLELQTQAEEYINSIEKSELRIMFRMYYIDDLTWIQVAHRMNRMFPRKRIKYTEDSCRMKNKRFFEKK